MQDFAQWSLDVIREDGAYLSWLEEQRFDWTNPLSLALEQILNGKTIILITDEKRKWFEQYILCSINEMNLDRPLLPIVSMDSLYQHYGNVSGGEMIDVVEDMISLSYKDDYFFWYIGKGDDKRSDIAKRKDNSYFWIFDEEYLNGFTLKSYDPKRDIKLLQLYKLFDASLNATIFGEVDVKS
ncbi:HobA family DNA replication regulator [Sulfurimonas sp. CS5]|uniref:HobA family DNA replication regulator n=1 Tax=Sulfurimonas sp. CS5 TaxID=3391145 RepID=UPI0039ED2D01